MPSLVEIGPDVLEKKIFKFCRRFFAFLKLSPLGKGRSPSFKLTWVLFIQGCILPNLVEIGPVAVEKKFFLILSMYFCYFVIISPWIRVGPFIWSNLNPLHPRMLCAMFRLKLAQWFWSRRWKCEKFTTMPMTPTTTIDNGQILIRKAHLSLWPSQYTILASWRASLIMPK